MKKKGEKNERGGIFFFLNLFIYLFIFFFQKAATSLGWPGRRALHVRETQPRPSLGDCEEDIFFREDACVRQVCRNPCARTFYLSASIQTGIRCVVFVFVVVAVVVCLCVSLLSS
jgi:hypothetical protein